MWLFRQLLRLYPSGFRAEYGPAMEQQFREEWGTQPRLFLLLQAVCELMLLWPQLTWAEFTQDAKYFWRSWRKRTLVTLLAVLSLGMAIGVSTGVYSVIDSLLYRSLPFREPDRLVHFRSYFAPTFEGRASLLIWKADHSFLSDVATFSTTTLNFTSQSNSFRAITVETTANFFQLLGTPLHIGRGFLPEEDQKGKNSVAVLSHAFYQQAFGGDARVLGQKIILNQQPFTVVGIAAPSFDYPDNAAIWLPTAFDQDRIQKSGVNSGYTMARLQDGLSFTAATSAFEAIASRRKEYGFPATGAAYKPKMLSLRDEITAEYRDAIWILFAGVAAVLLIACANLSHLLLSRFAERESEFRIRAWLGAGTSRIHQQILTECVLLSLAAGFIGLGFAWLTIQIGTHYYPPQFEFQRYEILEGRVLLFTFAVSMICGLCFSLAPLLLRREGRSRWTPRLRLSLLAVQICLSALLTLNSLSLGRGLLDLYKVDLGYKTAQVHTATISTAGTSRNTSTNLYLEEALAAISRLPGVEAVAAIDFLPLANKSVKAGSYIVQTKTEPELAIHLSTTPGFLNTVGAQLVAGRDFTAADKLKSNDVAIVDESFARLDGGVDKILGRKLKFSKAFGDQGPSPTVVGVVKNFRFAGPAEDTMATVIRPFAQKPQNFFTLTVRSKPGTPDLTGLIQSTLNKIDPKIPVYDVLTFTERLNRALARPNFFSLVLFFFGAFSLLLTLIHGYSLCAQMLDHRRREMGIRSALGATPSELRWLILRHLLPAVVTGLAAAFLLSNWAASFLVVFVSSISTPPTGWRATVVAILAATAAGSIWLKTRSLLKLPPAETLRAD
jgi:putative ABC transport system permease protein